MDKGKMIHSPLFSLAYFKATTYTFSVVASKKVSKKAVIRNRNKRRIREILRKMSPLLETCSVIVFIKKDLSLTDFVILKEELGSLIAKVK